MKINKIKKTKYYSYRTGTLAKGCQLCVKGEKLVLFITGLCSARCDFCPVSDKKLYKDVVYANERPIKDIKDIKEIITEAKLCDAKGAGITGGDPLMKLDRTIQYIKLLKKTFGKDFHIHLYTHLKLLNKEKLKKLHRAGLDEIRLHPDLDRPSDWNKILLAKGFDWDVGIEIPVIPEKEKSIIGLIHYIKDKVDFLNLNELELADNAVWRKKKNIKCRDSLSYAIKGSDELAKKLLKHCEKAGIRTHYCTCKLKDKVQLAKRIKKRANNIRQKFDRVTKEGMLIRGSVYLPDLKPGFGYHEKINSIDKEKKRKILNNLERIKRKLVKQEQIPNNMVAVDKEKLRLITSTAIVRKIKTSALAGKLARAIVTEYPTFDALEIEVEFLS